MTKRHMKCPYCHEEILHANPTLCPYCGKKILISEEEASKLEIEEIEKVEKAGRYEEAAQKYEELEMWDKARECRRKAKTNSGVSASVDVGKVGTISMLCPYCGESQPLSSKSNEVTCTRCGKNFAIPKNVLDLL